MTRRGTIGQIDLEINFVNQHAWDSKAKQWIDETGRVWSSEYYCRACGKNCWDGPESEVGSLKHHAASSKHQGRVLWYTDSKDDIEDDDNEDQLQESFNQQAQQSFPLVKRARSRTPISRSTTAPATVAKAKSLAKGQPTITELVSTAKKDKGPLLPRDTSKYYVPPSRSPSTPKVPVKFVPPSTEQVAAAPPPDPPPSIASGQTQPASVPSPGASASSLVPTVAANVPEIPPGWMLVPVPQPRQPGTPFMFPPQSSVIVLQAPQLIPFPMTQQNPNPFAQFQFQPFQFQGQTSFGQHFPFSGNPPASYHCYGQPYWPY